MPKDPRTPASVELLQRAVTDSGRKASVQLKEVFARQNLGTAADAARPWLAQLVTMGEVPLKVYLTLVLLTRKPPHDLFRRVTASQFAEMLNYDHLEPTAVAGGPGTRRVRRALRTLRDNGLIELSTEARHHDKVTKVNHAGGGDEPRPPYITVPLELWRNGWIVVMRPPALAVYLALRLEAGGGTGDTDGLVLAPADRGRYTFSGDTWTRGTAQLQELGLLRVGPGVRKDRWNYDRSRRVYRLQNPWMIDHTPGDDPPPVTDTNEA